MVNQWKGSLSFHQHSKVIELDTGVRDVSLWIQNQAHSPDHTPFPPLYPCSGAGGVRVRGDSVGVPAWGQCCSVILPGAGARVLRTKRDSAHLERVFSMTLSSHQMESDPTTGWWVGSAVFPASLGAFSTP